MTSQGVHFPQNRLCVVLRIWTQISAARDHTFLHRSQGWVPKICGSCESCGRGSAATPTPSPRSASSSSYSEWSTQGDVDRVGLGDHGRRPPCSRRSGVVRVFASDCDCTQNFPDLLQANQGVPSVKPLRTALGSEGVNLCGQRGLGLRDANTRPL